MFKTQYKIFCSKNALEYITNLQKDEMNSVFEHIKFCLGEHVLNRSKRCNMKAIKGSKEHTHRLHISMRHTIFYTVDNENKIVYVDDAMSINQAHSKYGLM